MYFSFNIVCYDVAKQQPYQTWDIISGISEY